jgi:hypothetical protein
MSCSIKIFPEEWSVTTYSRLLIIGFISYEVVVSLVFTFARIVFEDLDLLSALMVVFLGRHLFVLFEVLASIIVISLYLLLWSVYFAIRTEKRIQPHYKVAIFQAFLGFIAPTCYFYWRQWDGEEQAAAALSLLFGTQPFGAAVGTCFGLLIKRFVQPAQSERVNSFVFIVIRDGPANLHSTLTGFST